VQLFIDPEATDLAEATELACANCFLLSSYPVLPSQFTNLWA